MLFFNANFICYYFYPTKKREEPNFSSLLLDIRMKKAKILLDHTDLTIEKIAAVLGYSNSSNFYKSFRHYYGKSPRSLS